MGVGHRAVYASEYRDRGWGTRSATDALGGKVAQTLEVACSYRASLRRDLLIWFPRRTALGPRTA